MNYPQPTSGKPLVLSDMRLTRLMQNDPGKCATVGEYAAATGIDVARIIELFGPALDAGVLSLEPVGAEIFVHTAPHGRPVPAHLPAAEANLWERLRSHSQPLAAARLWKQTRDLEDSGWRVEASPRIIMLNLSNMVQPPQLAVVIQSRLAPVILYPSQFDLADPEGRLTALARAGAHLVAVLCASGDLDQTATAARAWYHATGATSPVVVVLEAPRYHPVVVRADDASVAPRSFGIAADTAE